MEICVDRPSRTENDTDLPSEPGFRAVEVLLGCRGQLKRVIAGLGLCAADAEDVLQDLSVEAIKKGESFAAEGIAMAWLTRVAINLCMDRHRRKKRFRTATKKIIQRRKHQPESGLDPQLTVMRAEQFELVRDSLAKLDEKLLGPMVLKYFGGLNSVQIAETLNENSSTIRSRIRIGRLKLAKALTSKGIGS